MRWGFAGVKQLPRHWAVRTFATATGVAPQGGGAAPLSSHDECGLAARGLTRG
jgi:hypothetical protein